MEVAVTVVAVLIVAVVVAVVLVLLSPVRRDTFRTGRFCFRIRESSDNFAEAFFGLFYVILLTHSGGGR